MNNPDIEHEISMYDGEIRFTDDYLQRTLRMLERYGIYTSNSIIIITADHGEELYDRRPHDPGSIGHGRTLYMELIRVPLIISIPGSSCRRKSISTYVQLLDIVPTILDVLHIKQDGYGQFQGRSLLPVIDGTDVTVLPIYGGARHGRGYIIKNGYKYYIDQLHKTASYKRPEKNDYVYSEELYDIKNDFLETKNVISMYPSIAAELREDLNLFKKKSAGGHGTSLPMELDQQAKDELKSLGYLQ
jgi:arylsulfatase A-like enzyme